MFSTSLKEVALVTTLCFAQLLTQAGLGQSVAPLHYIGDSFGVTQPGLLSWYPAGYSLTVGTFILPAGRLGDVFGPKRLLLIGWAWYSLWSLIAGLSIYTSNTFFIITRVFQGIGPALLLPNAVAVLGRIYQQGRRKEIVFSLFGATAPSGFTIAAVFASLLTTRVSWSWAYYIMSITCALLCVATWFFVPNDDESLSQEEHATERRKENPSQVDSPTPSEGTEEKRGESERRQGEEADNDDDDDGPASLYRSKDPIWERIDGNGAILAVLGLILINVPINQAPISGWSDPWIGTVLGVGLLFIIAFVLYEMHWAKHPLAPLASLSANSIYVLSCLALGWSSFGIWIYYLWQILETLRDQPILLVTAQVTPTTISGLIAAICSGLLIGRIGPAPVMLMAMLAFMIGNILVATMPINQTYWAQAFVAFLITPWGMDMSFPSSSIVLSYSVPRHHQGAVASMVSTVINYSISIGLGLAGTIEVHQNSGGTDQLKGFRAALYLAIGLAGLGVALAALFVTTSTMKRAKQNRPAGS